MIRYFACAGRNAHNLREVNWTAVRRAVLGALCCVFMFTPERVVAQQVREPLPLKVAVVSHGHDSRSSFELSPDGEWLAHTWMTDETVPESPAYTATGVPMAEGNDRKQISLVNSTTGRTIALGNPDSSNWAPVWSPDGNRVAYYSDQGGEAGIWVWEKGTGKTERFPGVIARSFFGFEILRWSRDSQRILCKILPEGMTIEQANALFPKYWAGRHFPSVGAGEPSVLVRKASGKNGGVKQDSTHQTDSEYTNRELGDLAFLDLRDHSVTRIAKRVKAQWFELSVDEKYLAYTSLAGWEANTQQSLYDIFLCQIADGATRKLGEAIPMGYGIELNWSPDSSQIAYISSGQLGKGEIVLLPVAGEGAKNLGAKEIPSFNDGQGEWPPLWDAAGQNIYAMGTDSKLWRVEIASGHGTAVGDPPGYKITAIVTRAERRNLWFGGDGHTVWVVAREREGTKAGIFRIDLNTGQSSPVLEDDRAYATIFNLDASDATGQIAYVAKDQQHLQDVWILDTKSGKTHQASHLNQAMERYQMGTARIIRWLGMDGQTLRGALLLPPGYQTGRRLPLVVWVYGGSNGSNYVNNFGFWGDYPEFNFHVLATRGYAVLFPDAPLGEGTPMTDLMKTVIPGVDAAIEQGYADPDRVAVMGQSYGSYCSLALISKTKRFKAAIITAAALHPDMVADYLRSPGYYEQGQGNMHGTPWDQRDRYLENSPVFLFDQIETPLLIGQGSADGDLVPSDAIFEGLQRLGRDVEYRLYENEGHVLSQKPNILDFWQRRLEFLADRLDLELDPNGEVVFEGERAKRMRKN